VKLFPVGDVKLNATPSTLGGHNLTSTQQDSN